MLAYQTADSAPQSTAASSCLTSSTAFLKSLSSLLPRHIAWWKPNCMAGGVSCQRVWLPRGCSHIVCLRGLLHAAGAVHQVQPVPINSKHLLAPCWQCLECSASAASCGSPHQSPQARCEWGSRSPCPRGCPASLQWQEGSGSMNDEDQAGILVCGTGRRASGMAGCTAAL